MSGWTFRLGLFGLGVAVLAPYLLAAGVVLAITGDQNLAALLGLLGYVVLGAVVVGINEFRRRHPKRERRPMPVDAPDFDSNELAVA
jgi:hypothetical protein